MKNINCSECNYLKVISVPDFFGCKITGKNSSTLTEINLTCPLNCEHEETLFKGSNICKKCGCFIIEE